MPPLNKFTTKAKDAIKNLGKEKIDIIYCSPFVRTKETAEIVGKVLKIKPKLDKRLREINFGIFNCQISYVPYKFYLLFI